MTERSHGRPGGRSGFMTVGAAIFYLVVLALIVLSFRWLLLSQHSDAVDKNAAAPAAPQEKTSRLDLMSGLDVYANNSASDALSDLVYIKKIYTIPEDAMTAPRPDPTAFHSTDDPAEVQAVVDAAAELLDGQTLCWNPDIERRPGTPILYYYDETILVICWKENINGCAMTFSEVKIAHPSQLRRSIAGGVYGSGKRYTVTSMADTAHAVVAIDGDFYDYRQLGITAYQRQIYRNKPENVDSCFFTASGDMLFSHRGELMGEGEAEKFIEDNDVLFAIAFGPILVENGEATVTKSYPVGEVMQRYTRASIGQFETLHYLLMTAGFEDNLYNVMDINGAAQVMASKGVERAYAVDGGQSAVIYFKDGPFNHVDFGEERTQSDIIYFATAIPDGGVEP